MSGSRVKIYSFRLHRDPTGQGRPLPIKGTREGIARYMMEVPIEMSEEEVDPSILDEYGFDRSRAHSKASSETS